MAKPSAGGRRPRKKERKNVPHGVAHIKSSFNNTIITITDQQLIQIVYTTGQSWNWCGCKIQPIGHSSGA